MADEFESPRPRWRSGLPGLIALIVVAVLAAAASFMLAGRASQDDAGGTESAKDLAALTELYEALNNQAVDPPDKEALVRAAIEGMLKEVDDPYARYFPADEFEEFSASLDGTFSGVGLMLEETPQGPVIVSVLEGTPADKAGIEEGERIVRVNGENVRDDPLEQIVMKVKGDPGTTVRLGLEGGNEGPRELRVTRAEFDLPIVTSETLEDDVGYINLLQFVDGTGERVRDEVGAMVDDGVAGVMLDLRENPGGLLNEAVAVASLFIEDGEIVTVEERSRQREVFEAVGDAYEQVPLVVLVDDHSASASEIVAGAIQDADRGSIVGEQTFGKGTVQTITQLPDGSGAKFTTARYYTPSGDSIEGVGVKPDVEAAAGENGELLDDDPQVQAAVDELLRSADGERSR
jgi:carboxyl-terminal processing protease